MKLFIVEEDETLNETEADDVDDEKIDEVSTTWESNVVELSTTYVSPKWEVPMDVTYTLDSDNKITEISASTVEVAHEKHVINLNNGIQSVIGMTVEDASEYSVSGSSLATAAFQEVMKG